MTLEIAPNKFDENQNKHEISYGSIERIQKNVMIMVLGDFMVIIKMIINILLVLMMLVVVLIVIVIVKMYIVK